MAQFSPSQNWKIIEKQGEPGLYWRFKDYSEIGPHPTPFGRTFTIKDGQYWTGPHRNQALLEEILHHIALNVCFACDVLVSSLSLDDSRAEDTERMRSWLDEASGLEPT